MPESKARSDLGASVPAFHGRPKSNAADENGSSPAVRPFHQFVWDLNWALTRNSHRPNRLERTCFRIAQALVAPVCKFLLRGQPIVLANVWHRPLFMQANHHLPHIVSANPLWSLPLVHSVHALGKENVQIIDVGANIGDTVALLESHLPGLCRFLCIEPDDIYYQLCRSNTQHISRVLLRKCFVSDTGSSALVIDHREPGTATTRIRSSDGNETPGQQGRTLDEVDAMLGDTAVDLIKIDTDGFDYKVLRSGINTLKTHRPALFFEWYPQLWEAQGEDSLQVFDFLRHCGYTSFAFFADNGFFHALVSLPDIDAIEALRSATLARSGLDNVYFDVLAAPLDVCKRTIEFNLQDTVALAKEKQSWWRMQPKHWR
jgi:FkbM family methyltransferase